MELTLESVEKFLDNLRKDKAPLLSFPEVKAECKIHGTEEVQDIVAHGPGIAVFEYSCGCTSRHETGQPDKWSDKEGTVHVF